MANSFAPKNSTIPLRPKAAPEQAEEAKKEEKLAENSFAKRGGILPNPKKKGKAYNLYISVDVMDKITAIAEVQGISVSQTVSALLRSALEQL